MNWLKNKLRNWLGIQLNSISIENHTSDIENVEKIIKERTEYHVDVRRHSEAQVIVIGKYGNRDFIQCYSVKNDSIKELIDHCGSLERYATRGRVDGCLALSTVYCNKLRENPLRRKK